MTKRELLQYRLKLFHESIRMEKKPDRVPHYSSFFNWMVYDSGYSLKESAYNYEVLDEIIINFVKKYSFDCISETGSRIIPRIVNPIGGLSNSVDYENEVVNVIERELIKRDEYDEYMQNPDKFAWEVMLPRKYSKFGKNMQVSDIKAVVAETLTFFDRQTKIAERIEEETGTITPKFSGANIGFLGVPFENLASFYRGIKGISMDMRSQPEKVKEFCDFQFARSSKPILETIKNGPKGSNENAPFDLFLVMLQHNILNIKQWENYYWPYLEECLDAAIEADKTVFIMAEGSISRFYEYFTKFKKGHIAIQLEQDNILEVRKALPNVCLVGGMTTSLLGKGTRNECVAYAKHLINELGSQGGFIIGQNKMMSFRTDCKAENLKAVCDFVQKYRP